MIDTTPHLKAENAFEQAYLTLLHKIKTHGERRGNRTGEYTLSLTAQQLRADLRKGYPAITSRLAPFKSTTGELKGFVSGATSAETFRSFGCKFWDKDANENWDWLQNPNRKGVDDVGNSYGFQWRNFGGTGLDQLQGVVDGMVNNPLSRRLVCMAWNPSDVDKTAVPWCHMGFHVVLNPSTREADMVVHQRSADVYLGTPSNVMSYAALLSSLCHISGMWTPRELIINMDDCHLYSNHLPQVDELLRRPTYALPKLVMEPPPRTLDDLVNLTVFSLSGYKHGPALTADMATTPAPPPTSTTTI